MEDIDNIIEKFDTSIFENFDRDNFYKIVNFLEKENCYYMEDILEDYLDLFIIPYEEFVLKYNTLNKKYNNRFLEYASSNMDLLEELY